MTKPTHSIALIAFILFAVVVNAEPILQPEGLEPGDQYRLTFTTSTRRDATSADIADYNDFVQATADAAPVVGNWGLKWKALVSTGEVTAIENTGTDYTVDPGVPVYRVDGVLFGEGNDGLWNPPEETLRIGPAAPNVDEFGNQLFDTGIDTDLFVWTGTFSTGTPSIPENIPLGSSLNLATYGNAGTSSRFPNFWISNAIATEEFRFYTLSEVITAVPEPNIRFHWLVGLVFAVARYSRAIR